MRGGKTDQTGVVFLGQMARVAVWLVAFLSFAHMVPGLKEQLLANKTTLTGAAVYAVFIGVVAWLASGALRLALHRVLQKRGESVDQTAVRFLSQLLRVAVWVLAFVSYARVIPELHDLGTAWLTSAGVLAVVVGMAAQNTLGNLIAGISLVLYRPFQLGDQLQVTSPAGLVTGFVENISLGYTTLRLEDERRLVIPNNLMASQAILNLSMSKQPVPCAVVLSLEHDADADKARQVLLEVARQQPGALGTPTCRITNLSGAGVTVTLTAWAANPRAVPDMKCDLLEAVKKRFDQAGIQLHRDCVFAPSKK
jgi:small-conductance mechanosensitive channel